MSSARENDTVREAVGFFGTADTLQEAIDELMSSGFDRAELSLLAGEHTVDEKLGHKYQKVKEIEDDAGLKGGEDVIAGRSRAVIEENIIINVENLAGLIRIQEKRPGIGDGAVLDKGIIDQGQGCSSWSSGEILEQEAAGFSAGLVFEENIVGHDGAALVHDEFGPCDVAPNVGGEQIAVGDQVSGSQDLQIGSAAEKRGLILQEFRFQ